MAGGPTIVGFGVVTPPTVRVTTAFTETVVQTPPTIHVTMVFTETVVKP